MVELATVLPDALTMSLAFSGLCFASSRLPAPVKLSLTVSLFPAATVTVSDPTTTVFFVVFADAATAITFPWRSVSTTERVSVTVHDLAPEQLTGTLAVVPDTLKRPTDAIPGLDGPNTTSGFSWPLLV